MAIVRNKITCADVLDYLRSLPDDSVDCVITSPPYYGLRDYSADGQIGLEPTLQEYIASMVTVFEEVKRVLKTTGTCWVNMGDSYSGSGKGGGGGSINHNDAGQKVTKNNQKRTAAYGFKLKDLMLVPFRLAIALQEAGWWVRSDIIWHKPNPMPESVTDRPTTAHEHVFLLSKRARYFYDAEAVREPIVESTIGRGKVAFGGAKGRNYVPEKTDPNYRGGSEQWGRTFDYKESCSNGRNKRSVWTVATQPYSGAHFAAFPQKLVEPCLLAGCPREVCSKCGAPVERVVEKEKIEVEEWKPANGKSRDLDKNFSTTRLRGNLQRYRDTGRDHDNPFPSRITTGFRPTCDCDAGFVPGLVLDPFMGSGTVALVSIRHGRDYIGCDINPEYVSMAQKRIADFDPYQATPVGDDGEVQLSLFGEGNSNG